MPFFIRARSFTFGKMEKFKFKTWILEKGSLRFSPTFPGKINDKKTNIVRDSWDEPISSLLSSSLEIKINTYCVMGQIWYPKSLHKIINLYYEVWLDKSKCKPDFVESSSLQIFPKPAHPGNDSDHAVVPEPGWVHSKMTMRRM